MILYRVSNFRPRRVPAYRCQIGNLRSLNCSILPRFVIHSSEPDSYSFSYSAANRHRHLTTRAMLGYPIQTTSNNTGSIEVIYSALSTVELEHNSMLHTTAFATATLPVGLLELN